MLTNVLAVSKSTCLQDLSNFHQCPHNDWKKNAHNSLNLIPTIKKYLSLSNKAFDVRPFPKMPSLSKTVHCADKYLHYPKPSTFFTNVLIISKTSTGPHNDTQTGAHHQLSEWGCFTCSSHHRWWRMRRTTGWMTPTWWMTQARVNQCGLAKACCRS